MHPSHNSLIIFSAQKAATNNLLSVVGTDAHHYGQLCLSALAAKTLPKITKELTKLILSGDSLIWVSGHYIAKP